MWKGRWTAAWMSSGDWDDLSRLKNNEAVALHGRGMAWEREMERR